jgi:mono/diheme cytochrome c family protein
MESTLAGHAMDASVARAAPKLTNPVAADEASLVAGARLYRDHCALCHGDPLHPKSPLADSLNPPPPQFMDEMADMPENQNFYILEHGIRWTAMPGWKNVLTVQQIWQTVTFLSHMNDLPSTVKQVFTETARGAQPVPGPTERLRVACVANDRFFQGDIGAPSSTLGNTGTRSTVYASAGDAVDALLALGITPVS